MEGRNPVDSRLLSRRWSQFQGLRIMLHVDGTRTVAQKWPHNVLVSLTRNNQADIEFPACRCVHSYVSRRQRAGERGLLAETLYGQHYFSALDNRVYFTEADLRW